MDRTNTKHRWTLPRRHAVFGVAAVCALLLVGCAGRSASERGITKQPSMAGVRLPPVGDDPYMRDVRALADPDFAVRTRASRALVAAGSDALPALGRAGDLPVPVAGGLEVSATRHVVAAIVADAEDRRLDEHLGSPWPTVRRAAAVEVGRRDRWDGIPRLIERLDDPDREVRAASAVSLRRLTNQWFGFRASAAVGHRRSAADRWRHWWDVQGGTRPAEERSPAALADRIARPVR